MNRTISAGLAGLALIVSAGLANAATPLIQPLDFRPAMAKSLTDLPVRFNRDGLERLEPGGDVELTLPDGSRHDYVYEQTIDHGGGFKTIITRSPLTGTNERAIVTYGPQGAWGWMKTQHGDYRIYPSNNGYDLIAKRERQNFAPKWRGGDAIPGPDDPPEIGHLKGVPTVLPPSFKSTLPKVTPSPTVQSDLMLIYTKDLADKLGVGLMPMLLNLVASVNQAYVDSEVAIVLRLVNATMMVHDNSHGSLATLNGMNNEGALGPAFESLTWGAGSVRNAVGADFVALLRDGPDDTGGIGFLNKNPVTYPVSTAGQTAGYSVSNFCAGGCEGIVAHELGHNMGSHHDPHVIAYDSGTGTVDVTGVFAYSYGYYSCATGLTCNPYTTGAGACTGYAECAGSNANDFGTIMSYVGPRVMKFSNPNLSNCVPAGGAAGSPRVCGGAVPAPAPAGLVANNALSLNNVRGALSAYRNQALANLAGAVQFTNTGYSGAEGSTLTFTVSRTAGSSGAISVQYAVTAGTASAGTDYTAASGTLSWANGDTANKTFTVTLASDALVEGVETITATLSNPTGAAGVYLGYPTSAVGLIVEAWPLGTLGGIPNDPAGWSSPSSPASSVPWAIVNDSAPPGDPDGRSLKSGEIDFNVDACTGPFGIPVPCPSATQITRNFAAGTVAFAYRVSSYPGTSFLEFLVDGAVVFSASGATTNAMADTAWQFFSTTITAGNHTLMWRYKPGLGFPCKNTLPFGAVSVPYPQCVDRAWIDQLAIPPAQVAPPNPPRMINLSTRMQVGTGFDVLIGGFVISGGSKNVAVVATGPSLGAFGISNHLANPKLTLVRQSNNQTIATNDDWQAGCPGGFVCGLPSGLTAAKLAPSNPLEAAILINLQPGAYTAIVEGVNGGTGVSVVAVYEVDGPTIPLSNIATRGKVGTGGDVMIGGFVISGNGPQKVAIVATGPSLGNFGIANHLANPKLTLVRQSNGQVIGTNDDWAAGCPAGMACAPSSELAAAKLAPSNSLEAGILITLNPGAYTAIVEGVNGGTGVAVIGVYKVN